MCLLFLCFFESIAIQKIAKKIAVKYEGTVIKLGITNKILKNYMGLTKELEAIVGRENNILENRTKYIKRTKRY